MRTMSATEAKQAFGRALDIAQREPVVIRKQNRDVAVLVSAQDYQELRRARIAELEALCDDIAADVARKGMTEELYAELMKDVD